MSLHAHTPFVLMILDGWGVRKSDANNAIAMSQTPNWDHIWEHYPHVLLSASGSDVGLPDQQMGNSEVGHLNLGAGQIVAQDYTRITQSIQNEQFYQHQTLLTILDRVKQSGGRLHVMGLLSDGGVHSHECHFHALLKLAHQHGLNNVCVHAFLDGRDTPPKSALTSINALDDYLQQTQLGKIATLIGRYYAMDRDNRWDRIQKAYDLIIGRQADFIAQTPQLGLSNAYDRGESDEFVKSTCIGDPIPIQPNDTVIFMNFRADRARQLTRAFIDPSFDQLSRKSLNLSSFATLTEYDPLYQTDVIFPPMRIKQCLGAYLAEKHYTQLRLAETEKYAHVTFFFNGGVETPVDYEDRQLIPSPKVATYDLQPEMSAIELTDALTQAIESKKYDVIICNYANADMVGHTGNFDAAKAAVMTIDTCLGRVLQSLQVVGGELLITADHGNIETMQSDITGQAHTAHTCSPVPLVYVGRKAHSVKDMGILADVAPTLLSLLGLEKPNTMTGHALFDVET